MTGVSGDILFGRAELTADSVDSEFAALASFVALAVDRVERVVDGAVFSNVFPVFFFPLVMVVGWEGANFCSHWSSWDSYVLLSDFWYRKLFSNFL